jgi:phage gp16-like protein
MARKIRALWIEMGKAGRIEDPSEKALRHFVKRMTGVDALDWLTVAQANVVIESLKKWGAR